MPRLESENDVVIDRVDPKRHFVAAVELVVTDDRCCEIRFVVDVLEVF